MTPDEERALGSVFAADARVRFAYLFGSVAAGTDRPDSDIDLAVSVTPRGTLPDDASLHDALAAALGRDDVDLAVLEDAPRWLPPAWSGAGRSTVATTWRECVTARRWSMSSWSSSPTTTPTSRRCTNGPDRDG
jgi:predicted nucleotidyltransferase